MTTKDVGPDPITSKPPTTSPSHPPANGYQNRTHPSNTHTPPIVTVIPPTNRYVLYPTLSRERRQCRTTSTTEMTNVTA
jgi:hypothetical protein